MDYFALAFHITRDVVADVNTLVCDSRPESDCLDGAYIDVMTNESMNGVEILPVVTWRQTFFRGAAS